MDYLALHTYADQNVIYSVGERIGVGKESDIMVVADSTGKQKVMKIHRLGRISFRTVKSNRDYLRKRSSKEGSGWMYLSRLAAMKEYAFMQALRDEGFAVPKPISQSRHTIVMSLVDAFPLRQISKVGDPAALYADLIDIILRLAKHGLITIGTTLACQVMVGDVDTSGEPMGMTLCMPQQQRWLRAAPAMVGTASLDWILALVGVQPDGLEALLAESVPARAA